MQMLLSKMLNINYLHTAVKSMQSFLVKKYKSISKGRSEKIKQCIFVDCL